MNLSTYHYITTEKLLSIVRTDFTPEQNEVSINKSYTTLCALYIFCRLCGQNVFLSIFLKKNNTIGCTNKILYRYNLQ